MTAVSESVTASALSDLFNEPFAFTLQLRHTERPGEAPTLRARCEQLVADVRARAETLGCAKEDVELAIYAWVALTDEVILTSDWPLKTEWLGRPLQLQLFNSFSAGEDFFVKLEQLRPQVATPAKWEALAVYQLALAFGFKGKHDDLQGMEALKALTQGLATELGAARPRKDDALSPRWKPLDGQAAAGSEVPVRLFAVVGLLIVLVLYLGVTAALSAGTAAALAGGR